LSRGIEILRLFGVHYLLKLVDYFQSAPDLLIPYVITIKPKAAKPTAIAYEVRVACFLVDVELEGMGH
jgi:hypothetical protein